MNFDIPKKNRPKIHEIEFFDFPSQRKEFISWNRMNKLNSKIPTIAWVALVLGGAVVVFHFIINPIFNLV